MKPNLPKQIILSLPRAWHSSAPFIYTWDGTVKLVYHFIWCVCPVHRDFFTDNLTSYDITSLNFLSLITEKIYSLGLENISAPSYPSSLISCRVIIGTVLLSHPEILFTIICVIALQEVLRDDIEKESIRDIIAVMDDEDIFPHCNTIDRINDDGELQNHTGTGPVVKNIDDTTEEIEIFQSPDFTIFPDLRTNTKKLQILRILGNFVNIY